LRRLHRDQKDLELNKARRPRRTKCERDCVYRVEKKFCGRRTRLKLDIWNCPFYKEKQLLQKVSH
jgi:hypothetical protein